MMADVSIIAAFIAGLLSFLSPCVLPLIPGFLAYLAGSSGSNSRFGLFLNSVFFVLGFSVVFALLGVALNTVLSGASYAVQTWLSRVGGVVIILFGLYLVGLIKISFLEREHKINLSKLGRFNIRYLTSFIFGAAFAVGWSPCVGAVLGSVLALAVSNPAQSFSLLMSYALGLGIPFLIVGIFSDRAITVINKLPVFLKYFNIVVGILLIIIGILVFTNSLNIVANLELLNRFLLS